jgi:glutamate-5-semialdehyde dehydrogenase
MSIKNESIKDEAIRLAKQAKAAARQLAPISSAEKNRALHLMADRIEAQNDYLIAENKKDLDAAKRVGISEAIVDRIALDASRVRGMAKDADPLGRDRHHL